MSKEVKRLIVEELAGQLKEVKELLVISTVGMTVNDSVKFRAALREKSVKALTVKNSLCARAFEQLGLGYAGKLLDGPSTLVYGGEDLISTAKAVVEAARKYKAVQIRGGAMEGNVLGAADVESLSKLPGREELVGMVVGALMSPAQGVIGALMSPASQLAGQIEEIADRAEKQAA